jgi:DNA-binding NarL/FixJ family response regulator
MTSSLIETERQTTVLMAYRYALTREGIAAIMKEAGFSVVGVGSLDELYQSLPTYKPDIVLLDWQLPDDLTEAIRTLTQENMPTGAVVLISPPQTSESMLNAIQMGARGCLSLNLTGEEFVARLRVLAKGDFIISQELASDFNERLAARNPGYPKDDLSDREREVLVLVSNGATNREIAQELTITENTVKVHLRHILEKLDLRNRQQAAAYAVREGLLDTDDSAEAAEG